MHALQPVTHSPTRPPVLLPTLQAELNCLPPNLEPKATDFIPQMVAMIQQIIRWGAERGERRMRRVCCGWVGIGGGGGESSGRGLEGAARLPTERSTQHSSALCDGWVGGSSSSWRGAQLARMKCTDLRAPASN